MSDFHRKPMPIDEIEEWIGCKKGALAKAFGSISQKEMNEFYKQMRDIRTFSKILNGVSIGACVFAIPFTAGGLLLRLTSSGREFDYLNGSYLSAQLVMPTVGLLMLSLGTVPVQKMLAREEGEKIQSLRARLPEHMLK